MNDSRKHQVSRAKRSKLRSISSSTRWGTETQVNILVYSMGDEVDDILRSFLLSEEDVKKYNVKVKFDGQFTKCRNVIYKCAKLNQL